MGRKAFGPGFRVARAFRAPVLAGLSLDRLVESGKTSALRALGVGGTCLCLKQIWKGQGVILVS